MWRAGKLGFGVTASLAVLILVLSGPDEYFFGVGMPAGVGVPGSEAFLIPGIDREAIWAYQRGPCGPQGHLNCY